MKKAFTILELLVVMSIMGLLGTIALGSYRAMQRGMEERGVMDNVNTLIRAAYQRAQIDRQPTAVYFWNETIRGRTEDENEIVVGRAVAVRRHGRITNVKNDNLLVDEFADLEQSYEIDNGSSASQMYLYPMDDIAGLAAAGKLTRSAVRDTVVSVNETLLFLGDEPVDTTGSGGTGASEDEDTVGKNAVPAYAFQVEDKGGVTWKPGMAYGFEFLDLTLPDNYIFGSDYSTTADNSIRSAGTLVFKPGKNNGGGLTRGGTVGRASITIYSLRQNGASLGAESVGDTASPEEDL